MTSEQIKARILFCQEKLSATSCTWEMRSLNKTIERLVMMQPEKEGE